MKSEKLWEVTSRVISNGVQTLSKAPNKHIQGLYPTYIEGGKGPLIYDNDGNAYIDYPLGLGSILLGHSDLAVSEAIKNQLSYGLIFSLPSYNETALALKIRELIPSAEKMRFLKTGSEGCAAAVKIARSYTGREKLLCCGYHGWHDWYTVSTPKNKGIPKCYSDLIAKVEYGNTEQLEELLKTEAIAGVILEPYIYEGDREFLHSVVSLCEKYGTLAIFDEVVTGFRTIGGSAQVFFEVSPHLSVFGKALGNGLPISVVCGQAKYMDELEGDCFVSSTFGGELLSIAAAQVVIDKVNSGVVEHIWEMGSILKDGYNKIATDLGVDTKCIGYPCRTMFIFPTGNHKSLFWQECIKGGVFFGYAQFISASHKTRHIEETLDIVQSALKVVKNNWADPLKAMEGEVALEVFRLVALKGDSK